MIENETETDETIVFVDNDSELEEIGDEGSNDSGEMQDETQGANETEEAEEILFDGEVVASVAENTKENSLIRQLREEIKQSRKAVQQLSSALNSTQESPKGVPVRPTYEDCKYDDDLYAEKMEAYARERVLYEQSIAKEREAQKKDEESYKARYSAYEKSKESIRFDDFELVEEEVRKKLSPTQFGVLVYNASRPEYLVYALGKNSSKLSELANVTDPIEFTYKLSKIEDLVKVTRKSMSPAPEKQVSGSSRNPGVQAEKLYAEYMKTGDATKLLQARAERQMEEHRRSKQR